MIEKQEVSLDAPIAGQGLTHELGNRPWQNPPQYSTVEEALQFHIPRIVNPDRQEELMNVIETGVPLTIIAETLQSGAVMQGKHSVDVGILIIPVLMETLAYLAEEQGVEYVMGTELKTDDTPSESAVALAMKKIREKREALGKEESATLISEEPLEPVVQEPPTEGGLMSRRM
jgi:hypothetical protein|tara:strand:- start:145 stop:666 length:522 start_codon:yes stop_codon:yes gene_type:complete